jgi:heptosyltransferase-2
MPSPERPLRSPERLLVRAPNWLGDVVLSLPAVRDLRQNFPASRLEVLARPAVAEIYRAVAEVDEVRESRGPAPDAAALRGVFDAAVLLPNSLASALAVWRAGIPERWGYATDGRGPLLTRRARVAADVRGRSEVYYYRAMLAGIGLRVSASPDASLACPEAWAARGRALLGSDGPWVGLNPGAFYGTAKRWMPERHAAVAELVGRRTGLPVAIVGGPGERPLAEWIAAGMRTKPRVLSGDTSLAELVGVLSRLRLLITNDSGPMHVAAALGVPVLAVFGSTDWRETAPFASGARPAEHRLVREHVYCSPCKLRECPIDHRCMRRVSVDRVLAEAEEMLAGGAL